MLMKSRKSFSLSISFSLKFENFSQLPFTAHGGGTKFPELEGTKSGETKIF